MLNVDIYVYWDIICILLIYMYIVLFILSNYKYNVNIYCKVFYKYNEDILIYNNMYIFCMLILFVYFFVNFMFVCKGFYLK